MDLLSGIQTVLATTLGGGYRAEALREDAKLLGAIPELDSMAVVNVIAAIEERFGVLFEDDEVTAEMFATVGTLCEAVRRKLNGG